MYTVCNRVQERRKLSICIPYARWKSQLILPGQANFSWKRYALINERGSGALPTNLHWIRVSGYDRNFFATQTGDFQGPEGDGTPNQMFM